MSISTATNIEATEYRLHLSRELRQGEASLTRRLENLGETDEPVTYRFRTPYLALNQDNYRRYESTADGQGRRELVESILRGNCLSVAKAFWLFRL